MKYLFVYPETGQIARDINGACAAQAMNSGEPETVEDMLLLFSDTVYHNRFTETLKHHSIDLAALMDPVSGEIIVLRAVL